MRKILSVLIVVICTAPIWSQAPGKISYQAVIRNSSGNLVTNQQVGILITILQGSENGSAVYTETQTPVTNANGLVSIEIGGESGFDLIDWANGPYYIKAETDPSGGQNYTISGTSQILSVPYALYAGKAMESDPLFAVSPAVAITDSDITNWNGKLNAEIDGSTSNELQALQISNDTIYLSNGGFVKLPDHVTNVQIIDDSLFVSFKQNTINRGYIGRGAPGSTMAAVSTDSATDISYTVANIYANVTANGGEFVMGRGICYATTANPTLNNSCIDGGTGTGTYRVTLPGLTPNTTYYARAYASNAIGTSYGEVVSFNTLPQTFPKHNY